MDVDGDLDGLPDAREVYVYKTYPDDADSDNDGMPDGWEIQYGFNPLLYADGGFDADGDGVNNLAEYTGGTNPQVANVVPPDGAAGSLLFRYDEDGRMAESHLNNSASELYSLTPAHNFKTLDIYTN
jgi:hypothetical protein